MRIVSVCCGIVVSLASLSSPSRGEVPDSVRINLNRCKIAAADEVRSLGPDWEKYTRFIHSCSVRRESAPAFTLFSVWADEYEATLPASAPAGKYPLPVLLSPSGRKYGTLPVNFPVDPPVALVPVFSRWKNGFPHEIRLLMIDPTPDGNHWLNPLHWDPRSQVFK
jgi:hypothetical protein